MSGGSFSYLCYKEIDEIIGWQGDLSEMVNELNSTFPGSRAARDTEQFQQDIAKFREVMGERIRALNDVWKSVEWWRSGDYGQDDAQKAVDRYKMEKVTPHMTWVPNG